MSDPNTSPPTPAALSFDWVILAKWGATFALAGSVLALDVLKIPADHYFNLIVVPGLSMLGLHTAAKTLN